MPADSRCEQKVENGFEIVCRLKTLRQLSRAEHFSGTFRGVFQTFCFTFRFAFRFGIKLFGAISSAEVPPCRFGVTRPRKRKRTNQEKARTIPGQIGTIPENRESPRRDKKKGRTSPDRETPPFEAPRLPALDTRCKMCMRFYVAYHWRRFSDENITY